MLSHKKVWLNSATMADVTATGPTPRHQVNEATAAGGGEDAETPRALIQQSIFTPSADQTLARSARRNIFAGLSISVSKNLVFERRDLKENILSIKNNPRL